LAFNQRKVDLAADWMIGLRLPQPAKWRKVKSRGKTHI